MKTQGIFLPNPEMQAGFAVALERIRRECLQEALATTVRSLSVASIDKELNEFAPTGDLSSLAGRGLRGELVFAVPCILQANPRLLGYYRLLLGFSQKGFYTAQFGTSGIKGMEEHGRLNRENKEKLAVLCRALASASSFLLGAVGIEKLTRNMLDDLTLLTLGPQLRGGANVKKGMESIKVVFRAIQEIVGKHNATAAPRRIDLLNAAKRPVVIEFAADPDIVIRENMPGEEFRNIIAIEVKGGTDFSNIHNRLGEAEKSHQKARQMGFVECWTVVNVDRIDPKKARRESPSTNRFYRISQITSRKGEEYADFRKRIISLLGIPGK